MVNPSQFIKTLIENGVGFFAGVPDSLLKQVCLCVDDELPPSQHQIAASEGGAIGLAAGYHLATGNLPLVYMQNSGLGNAINPLTSLTDPEVYGIPIILLIGWRGEPGIADEPQHKKMGRITLSLLEVLEVPYFILPENQAEAESLVLKAIDLARSEKRPVALVVQKGVFAEYENKRIESEQYPLTREEALKTILSKGRQDDVFVSTTGKLSRELFELRENSGQSHRQDFLTVGSMGHASQIALGVAKNSPKRVFCLDGDGALLMHLGGMAIAGISQRANFYHILFNNGSHESVGGQNTAAFDVDLPAAARACGYKMAWSVSSKTELDGRLDEFLAVPGPVFLEIRLNKKSRGDLGRPTSSPAENKNSFMDFIQSFNG